MDIAQLLAHMYTNNITIQMIILDLVDEKRKSLAKIVNLNATLISFERLRTYDQQQQRKLNGHLKTLVNGTVNSIINMQTTAISRVRRKIIMLHKWIDYIDLYIQTLTYLEIHLHFNDI